MIATTTIARDLVTAEIGTAITANAQAALDTNPDANQIWADVVTDIQSDPEFTGDAYVTAVEMYPAEFEAYALSAYAKKTIDWLGQPVDLNQAPKITLPHDFLDAEIVAALTAEVVAREEIIVKKPWRTLSPNIIQSKERLAKIELPEKSRGQRKR